jgi:hypothetical protein
VTAGYTVTGNYAGSGGAGYPDVEQNTQSFSFTADPDEAISVVEYDIPIGSRTDFILTYGTGSTVSGWMSYYAGSFIGNSTSTVSLDSMTRSENFFDAQVLGYALIRHVQFSAYGINTSTSPPETGFTLYAQGYGLWSNEIVFFPVENIENNLITSITITSDRPITISIEKSKRTILQTTLRQGAAEYISGVGSGIVDSVRDWLSLAASIGPVILEVVIQLFYWVKFLFWDNLLMTIAIYIGITGAVSFNQSKDIFQAIKKFINYQKSLFLFVLSLWQVLIDLIDRFRNIFRL